MVMASFKPRPPWLETASLCCTVYSCESLAVQVQARGRGFNSQLLATAKFFMPHSFKHIIMEQFDMH